MTLDIDTTIGIPEAAERAKVPERTMRDRLTRLNRKLTSEGRANILERDGRLWKVRLEALKAEMRTKDAADKVDIRIEELEGRVEELSDRQTSLRDTVQAERRRQKRRWDAQVKVNDGLRQAMLGMSELEQE